MSYKLLIFDADNTLFDFEYAEREALNKIAEELKLNTSLSEIFNIYQRINKQIWKEFEEKIISAENLKVERFRRFFSEIHFNTKAEYYAEKYLYYLSTVTKLLPDAFELISEFSKKYKIAIVTNGLTSVQKPRFQNSEIRKFVNAYVISEEVGVSKPQPEIFQLACNQIGKFEKSEILVIGDNFSSDIIGGFNFGVDTCWFNFTKEINPNGLKPKYEIYSLKELELFL
jgi:putative hydrolase of the HAD superfamily